MLREGFCEEAFLGHLVVRTPMKELQRRHLLLQASLWIDSEGMASRLWVGEGREWPFISTPLPIRVAQVSRHGGNLR